MYVSVLAGGFEAYHFVLDCSKLSNCRTWMISPVIRVLNRHFSLQDLEAAVFISPTSGPWNEFAHEFRDAEPESKSVVGIE